jgi:putative flippase GtrA
LLKHKEDANSFVHADCDGSLGETGGRLVGKPSLKMRRMMAPATLIRSALLRQEIRFIIAGASGTLLFFVLSYIIASAGMPPFGGTLITYALTFVTVYTVHRYWTFSVDVPHGKAFPRYLFVQAVCALMSAFVAHFLVNLFGFQPLAMSALTAVASAGLSYFATSLWVFAER